MTVYQAKRLGVKNFSMLVSHVRVPPAIEAIMTSPTCRVQGFLAAGHVCSVMGTEEYPAAGRAVRGADRGDRLRAAGHPGGHPAARCGSWNAASTSCENAYPRAVPAEGNPAARALLTDVFQVTDRGWRGIGVIPDSGWRLSEKYREFDAEYRFEVAGIDTEESTVCRSGEVLQGLIKPHECAAFGKECTPRNPLGATMVSSEGACAAYYLYRRLTLVEPDTEDRVEGSGRCLRCSTAAALDFEGWTCPLPLRDSPNIVMGHGGGGQMSAELIDHLFVPAFGGAARCGQHATRR